MPGQRASRHGRDRVRLGPAQVQDLAAHTRACTRTPLGSACQSAGMWTQSERRGPCVMLPCCSGLPGAPACGGHPQKRMTPGTTAPPTAEGLSRCNSCREGGRSSPGCAGMRWSFPRAKNPRHTKASASHMGGMGCPSLARLPCIAAALRPSAWICTQGAHGLGPRGERTEGRAGWHWTPARQGWGLVGHAAAARCTACATAPQSMTRDGAAVRAGTGLHGKGVPEGHAPVRRSRGASCHPQRAQRQAAGTELARTSARPRWLKAMASSPSRPVDSIAMRSITCAQVRRFAWQPLAGSSQMWEAQCVAMRTGAGDCLGSTRSAAGFPQADWPLLHCQGVYSP